MFLKQEPLTIDEAIIISGQGFGRTYDNVPDASPLKENEVRTIYYNGNKVGFVLYRMVNKILYLSAIVLLPDVQGKGVAKQIILKLKEQNNASFLAYRTQSSRMWAVGKNLCSTFMPAFDNPKINEQFVDLVQLVCLYIKADYPVTKGFYGQGIYGIKPIHHIYAIQRWWDSICDYQSGDSVTCIGCF